MMAARGLHRVLIVSWFTWLWQHGAIQVYEQRRVRFSNIDGLERQDLAIAGEVWLDELVRAPWITREAIKLATHFVRYMRAPDPARMILREIESEVQLGREDMLKTLKQMRTYGAIETFTCDRADLRVSLHLSFLQRLRVLEVTARFGELAMQRGRNPRPWVEAERVTWVPEPDEAERSEAEAETSPPEGVVLAALTAAA